MVRSYLRPLAHSRSILRTQSRLRSQQGRRETRVEIDPWRK